MKRLIAVLLSALLILGAFTIGVLSADVESEKSYAGVGDYTVMLQADPKTNIPPADFGTVAANGKVWTDKSVEAINNRFEVTLSALAQEYISESEQSTISSTAADVVMILDLSASMQRNNLTLDNVTMTRTKAMVKAVNEALEIIMRSNKNNRVLIYTYQSNSSGSAPVTNQLLPLGHYTNTDWAESDVFSNNSGKYFNYSAGNSSGVISSSANLKKDGAAFQAASLSTASGTCTQHGILKGLQTLATAIGQENKSVDRKPYVLLFTDGAPGNATKTWYDSSSTDCSFSHENNGTAEISALSILSAAYMKNVLNTAYQTYNGKDIGIEWFNIGLGVNSNELGTFFLQPWTLQNATTENAEDILSNITTYTSGRYSAYSSYATAYSYTVDSYLVNSGDDLENAFIELAEKIEEETKVITSPIISVEGLGSGLTFKDTIGEGMTINNICLHPKEDSTVYGIASGNTYSFSGYDMTATLTTDSQNRSVLTWNIPADEVAIYAFANRTDPTDETYIAAEPIRLSYDVMARDPDDYEGDILYSNAAASAEFCIAEDNTYYFEADGTMKTEPLASEAKEQNITGTSSNSVSYTAEQLQKGAAIKAELGNNGKLSPATQLEKSTEESDVQVGTAAAFTLAVTNRSGERLSNVVITDTLPEGLTYKKGSVRKATVQTDNQNLTFTISSIAAGETVMVTYEAVLDSAAAAGENFTNTAAITRIDSVDVYGPVDTSTTITSYRTYRVLYEWSGDIPAGQLPPLNNNRYITGANYPVDTNYTSSTKVENKDKFGNVTERWSFSGWEDEGAGVMGEADVTIRGVWRYESFSYPAHRVNYVWSGDIPPNKTPPTDENSYIKNQPYIVDSTYTAATKLETKDTFGNVNGRYTFSGWADPNGGLMGEADITIPGVWSYEAVVVPSYKVNYVWSGTVPEGEIIPTDENSYYPNEEYSVDTTHTSLTEILTRDAFGNINGRYTFSGWTDAEGGIMGNADVTVSGVWSYESVNVSTHKVNYIWSGEVPENAVLPTDENTYAKNQAYPVDETYTSLSELITYDEEGNPNGRYTFSGWTDSCGGIMGEEDVTIFGVWEFKVIAPPTEEEPTTTLPNSPQTDDVTPFEWAFAASLLSAAIIIFLTVLRKLKKA